MVTAVRTLFTGAPVQGGGVSTMHFEDPVDDPQAVVMLGWVRSFWDAIKGNLDEDLTINVEANPQQYVASTGALQRIYTAAAPASVVGTATGNSVPRASQGLVRWLTSDIVAGRMLKGRNFIPAIGTALVTDTGLLTPAAVTAIDAGAEGLITNSGGTLVVWHRPVNGAGGVTHLVTSASVWDNFAVLRSRRD